MSAAGWPGRNASGTKPGADGFGSEARTTRIYRIAELMVRYRATEDGKVWRYRCLESGKLSEAEYADAAMATSGARMAAACDIAALFDKVPS